MQEKLSFEDFQLIIIMYFWQFCGEICIIVYTKLTASRKINSSIRIDLSKWKLLKLLTKLSAYFISLGRCSIGSSDAVTYICTFFRMNRGLGLACLHGRLTWTLVRMAFCPHGVSSGATAVLLRDFDSLKFLCERMFRVMDLELL